MGRMVWPMLVSGPRLAGRARRARPRDHDGRGAGHQPADALPGAGPGRVRAGRAALRAVPAGVRVTPTGELVVAAARELTGRYDQLLADLERLLDPDAGVVRLAFLDSMATSLVPAAAALLPRRSAPGTRVELRQEPAHEILRDLESGAADLAITSDAAARLRLGAAAGGAAGPRRPTAPPAARPAAGLARRPRRRGAGHHAGRLRVPHARRRPAAGGRRLPDDLVREPGPRDHRGPGRRRARGRARARAVRRPVRHGRRTPDLARPRAAPSG